MANYYFLKGGEGNYEQQKELLLNFVDQQGYTNICFLHDTLDKMSETSYIGKALINRWGKPAFGKFVKARAIEVNNKTYSFGTLKTLGFSIENFDVIVHIYASPDSILKSMEDARNSDHIFVYWVQQQPKLDQWISILNGQKIRNEESITPIVWTHFNQSVIDELNRIHEVNVGDGGTHPGDQDLIKEVVKKINKSNSVLDAPTFKAYLIRVIGFSPLDAENAAHKVRNHLE